MVDVHLQNAIELVRGGKIEEGRGLLEFILKADPTNIPAWFWYVETWPTTSQRIQVLEACLRCNPNNAQVKQSLVDLIFRQKNKSTHQINTTSEQIVAKPEFATARSDDMSQEVFAFERESVAGPGKSTESFRSGSIPEQRQKPKQSSKSMWLVFGSVTLFLVFCVALEIMAYTSMPKDPGQYRHAQPVEYYLYVPKNYSPDRDWPLFVGIHGSGGSGLDCWNWWQTYADREGFILLCPSIADAGGGWYQSDGETKTFSAVNQVRANYRVMSREFIVGFSAGAQFVQGFSFKYPQYVSGVSILSAGNYYSPNLGASGIPFLVVIGDQDDPVSVQGSAAFSAALSQSGFEVQYDVLPGVGHTVTSKAKDLTIALFRKTIGK